MTAERVNRRALREAMEAVEDALLEMVGKGPPGCGDLNHTDFKHYKRLLAAARELLAQRPASDEEIACAVSELTPDARLSGAQIFEMGVRWAHEVLGIVADEEGET